MEWLGWGLFALLLIWYVIREGWYARRGNYLTYYAIFLMLRDDVREAHKRDMAKMVRNVSAESPAILCAKFAKAAEAMGERFSRLDPSTVGSAPAMLWQLKMQPEQTQS